MPQAADTGHLLIATLHTKGALYAAGEITIETALEYSDNPDQLRRRMGI